MTWTGKLLLAAALVAAPWCGWTEAAAPVESAPAETSAQQTAQAQTMALLWMRTAAEYRALCYQGYNAAMAEIDRALADPTRSGKPLAIVLDCDETVVDNTPGLAAAQIAGSGLYPSSWWNEWCARGEAFAMPGAVEFLQAVDAKGVAIFYVTNRTDSLTYDGTERNLRELGFPQADREHLLLGTDTGNKQPRFDRVTADYDVILYMGDNAGDLPIGTYGADREERAAIIDENRALFGTKYIVFPNPVYGAWVYAIADNYFSLTPEERDAANRALLGENVR